MSDFSQMAIAVAITYVVTTIWCAILVILLAKMELLHPLLCKINIHHFIDAAPDIEDNCTCHDDTVMTRACAVHSPDRVRSHTLYTCDFCGKINIVWTKGWSWAKIHPEIDMPNN